MYIGTVSKITGASIKAIRFYEEIGLLVDVNRSGKYRVYNEAHVILIQLILKARTLDFKLAEMKVFVERQNSKTPWENILDMIEVKMAQTKIEIIKLKNQQQKLSSYRKSIVNCLEDNPNCSLDRISLDSPHIGRL